MNSRTFEEQKRITQIPAPPYKELVRAEYFLGRMRELGFKDAAIDREGNVIATRKGTQARPKLVVSAHLDTVFPEGTDVTVKEKDGAYLAPGIGDNFRGLAALLSLIGVLNRSDIKTFGDVMFVGTVGEEELGICGALRRFSVIIGISMASSQSMDSMLAASSTRAPAATAMR